MSRTKKKKTQQKKSSPPVTLKRFSPQKAHRPCEKSKASRIICQGGVLSQPPSYPCTKRQTQWRQDFSPRFKPRRRRCPKKSTQTDAIKKLANRKPIFRFSEHTVESSLGARHPCLKYAANRIVEGKRGYLSGVLTLVARWWVSPLLGVYLLGFLES